VRRGDDTTPKPRKQIRAGETGGPGMAAENCGLAMLAILNLKFVPYNEVKTYFRHCIANDVEAVTFT